MRYRTLTFIACALLAASLTTAAQTPPPRIELSNDARSFLLDDSKKPFTHSKDLVDQLTLAWLELFQSMGQTK